MASGCNPYGGGGDEIDDELALALERSVISQEEEEHWNEVKEFVLDESAKDDSNELRFVVIGETGSGKSETSNSILMSRDLFESAMNASSVTKTCMVQKATVRDRPISIVDTPGLFDADMDHDGLLREITRCTMMTAPGPHAILLVIRIGRHSQQVQETVRIFRELFGEKCTDYMIVVFTWKSALSEGRCDCSVEDYIETLQKDVADVLRDCKHRYVVFENKVDPQSEENAEQVDELLQTVDDMVRDNHGRHYTSDMFEEAAAKMREQERLIRQQIEDEKQQEMRAMRKIYEDKLKHLEANQAMFELVSQSRDHELDEIEKRYKERDPKHEARKKAERGPVWEQFLNAVPTLLKIGKTVLKLYISAQKGTLLIDAPTHINGVMNLLPDDVRRRAEAADNLQAKGQKK